MVEHNGQNKRDNLTEYGRRRGARNAHFREAQISENQYRVENDIDNRADALRNHRINGFAGGLQKALKGNLPEHAEREHRANNQILFAVVDDFFNIGLQREKQTREKAAEQREHRKTAKRQKHGVARGLLTRSKFFSPGFWKAGR